MIREENLKEGNTFTLSVNQYADMSEGDFKNTKVNTVRSYSAQGNEKVFYGTA